MSEQLLAGLVAETAAEEKASERAVRERQARGSDSGDSEDVDKQLHSTTETDMVEDLFSVQSPEGCGGAEDSDRGEGCRDSLDPGSRGGAPSARGADAGAGGSAPSRSEHLRFSD